VGGRQTLNRYNFGCLADSDSLFDIADIEGLRDVAMATNFGTKIVITGFV